MTMFKGVLPSLPVLLMLSFIVNFGPATPVKAQAPAGDSTGTLQFVANGEDFIRQGFTSKDGWNISFDEVLASGSVDHRGFQLWRSIHPNPQVRVDPLQP